MNHQRDPQRRRPAVRVVINGRTFERAVYVHLEVGCLASCAVRRVLRRHYDSVVLFDDYAVCDGKSVELPAWVVRLLDAEENEVRS